MSVDELSVDKLSVDELSVDELSEYRTRVPVNVWLLGVVGGAGWEALGGD